LFQIYGDKGNNGTIGPKGTPGPPGVNVSTVYISFLIIVICKMII